MAHTNYCESDCRIRGGIQRVGGLYSWIFVVNTWDNQWCDYSTKDALSVIDTNPNKLDEHISMVKTVLRRCLVAKKLCRKLFRKNTYSSSVFVVHIPSGIAGQNAGTSAGKLGKTSAGQDIRDRLTGATDPLSRRNLSAGGRHELSRNRTSKDVPSSKYVRWQNGCGLLTTPGLMPLLDVTFLARVDQRGNWHKVSKGAPVQV
ncbi:casein kinase 1-like protein 10 [Artemisia annua]|uniref:Casein kinase 1-like protein 10 n=1 Tax=Artemisia annua TaxID=35608 RepID=A0A2U1KPB6_ARTAN|nr:casein kinase 1-like protein 10 [Artemisia annua]